MTDQGVNPAYIVKPDFGHKSLTPGVRLLVEMEQNIDGRPGPWRVGRAEVLAGGRLALRFTEASEAGRTARGLVADGVLDVVLWGSRPTVRLR